MSMDYLLIISQLIRELKEEVGKLRGLIKAEGLEAKVAAFGESTKQLDHHHCVREWLATTWPRPYIHVLASSYHESAGVQPIIRIALFVLP